MKIKITKTYAKAIGEYIKSYIEKERLKLREQYISDVMKKKKYWLFGRNLTRDEAIEYIDDWDKTWSECSKYNYNSYAWGDMSIAKDLINASLISSFDEIEISDNEFRAINRFEEIRLNN